MTLNTSGNAVIAHRRQLVAGMRLRHVSLREIVAALAHAGERNPRTGRAWSLGIVAADMDALEAAWRAEAARDTAVHKATMLAELREVRRRAWSDNALPIVLRSLQQEAQLLALDAPIKVDLVNVVREMAREAGLGDEDAQRAVVQAERYLRSMQGASGSH